MLTIAGGILLAVLILIFIDQIIWLFAILVAGSIGAYLIYLAADHILATEALVGIGVVILLLWPHSKTPTETPREPARRPRLVRDARGRFRRADYGVQQR